MEDGSQAGGDWVDEDAGTEQTLRDVHGGGDTVLAVGDEGVIIRRWAIWASVADS